MTEANKTTVRRFYEEMWNPRNLALVNELMVKDVSFRGSFDIESEGIEAFQEYMQMVHEAFPDFHTAIDALVAEDDVVAARLTYTGTHHGEIFGVSPTGRRITYHGAAFFALKKEKIVEGWVLGDLVGMLDQLLLEETEEAIS